MRLFCNGLNKSGRQAILASSSKVTEVAPAPVCASSTPLLRVSYRWCWTASRAASTLQKTCVSRAQDISSLYSLSEITVDIGSHRIYLGHVGRYPSPHVTLETTVRKGGSSREKTSSERRMSTDLREPDLKNNAKRAAGRDSKREGKWNSEGRAREGAIQSVDTLVRSRPAAEWDTCQK